MSGYLVVLSGGTFSRGKEIQYTLEVKEVIYEEGVVKVKVEVDKEVRVNGELGKKYVGLKKNRTQNINQY